MTLKVTHCIFVLSTCNLSEAHFLSIHISSFCFYLVVLEQMPALQTFA